MSTVMIIIAVFGITVILMVAIACIVVSGSISARERELYGEDKS